MTHPLPFRPKKKTGQIYVNIPSGGQFHGGRFHVQADGFDPHRLDRALMAASKAFWIEYERARVSRVG